MQSYEQTPYRGYLSSIQLDPQFGLDTISIVDSIIVTWPDNSSQKLTGVKANELLQIKKSTNFLFTPVLHQVVNNSALLTDITDSLHLNIQHSQKDVIDFNIQKCYRHPFAAEYKILPAVVVKIRPDSIADHSNLY